MLDSGMDKIAMGQKDGAPWGLRMLWAKVLNKDLLFKGAFVDLQITCLPGILGRQAVVSQITQIGLGVKTAL